jgi:hypothetical protein
MSLDEEGTSVANCRRAKAFGAMQREQRQRKAQHQAKELSAIASTGWKRHQVSGGLMNRYRWEDKEEDRRGRRVCQSNIYKVEARWRRTHTQQALEATGSSGIYNFFRTSEFSNFYRFWLFPPILWNSTWENLSWKFPQTSNNLTKFTTCPL